MPRGVLGLGLALAVASGCLPATGRQDSTQRYGQLQLAPGTRAWRGQRSGYSTYSGFVQTTALTLPPARSPGCQLDVLLEGRPARPHQVLGLVTVEKVGPAIVGLRGGEDQAVSWLKTKACRVGATVLYDVKTDSQWFEFRNQLIRSVRASATAGLYVASPAAPAAPSDSHLDPWIE